MIIELRFYILYRTLCRHTGAYEKGDNKNILDNNIRLGPAGGGMYACVVDLLGRQLLQALCHIHSFGYVHADIKVGLKIFSMLYLFINSRYCLIK